MRKTSLRLETILLLLVAISISRIGVGFASAFLPSPSVARAADRPRRVHHRPRPSSAPSARIVVATTPARARTLPADSRISATSLQSFFGLGPAEIAIVAVVGLVVIGPSKLLQFSKEAGSAAGKAGSGLGDEWGDLKAIPEEFQKGLEEGEIEARSRKAKVTDVVSEEKEGK